MLGDTQPWPSRTGRLVNSSKHFCSLHIEATCAPHQATTLGPNVSDINSVVLFHTADFVYDGRA